MDTTARTTNQQKWGYSLMAAIIVAIVFLPATFRLTQGIFGDWVADKQGLAKGGGIALHIVVGTILLYLIMLVSDKTDMGASADHQTLKAL
jgi:hypothetical protein